MDGSYEAAIGNGAFLEEVFMIMIHPRLRSRDTGTVAYQLSIIYLPVSVYLLCVVVLW